MIELSDNTIKNTAYTLENAKNAHYIECLEDIEIASDVLLDELLYPDNIIADFYRVPAHNHQTFYAAMSIDKAKYHLTYVKPHFYAPLHKDPIKMCSFAECRKAEERPPFLGKFIMGIKPLDQLFANTLFINLDAIPNDYVFDNDGICLDGVTQGVRVYKSGKPVKNVFYIDAFSIPDISAKQAEFLDSLYLMIEDIIT